MQTYIIDSKKAKKLWGGILPGYNITKEEIKKVEDKKHGDTLLETYQYNGGLIEITNTSKIDMCVIEGGLSCRDTSHCIGPFCSFCGKFDY